MNDSMAAHIERWRQGDAEAGDRLLRHFAPWLQLLARVQFEYRLQAKLDASDVVQQTMLEAARAIGQFRGRGELELAAWLRQILARALAHEVRRYRSAEKRQLRREVPLERELIETSRRLADMLPAGGTSPSESVERQERQVQLARALEQLPADYREVIVLRNLEGRSHAEIAQRMGRGEGAVRMLWVRALARLKQTLVGLQTWS